MEPPTAPSALAELASDPSSRKRFLRMAGGSALAASLATLIAACGEDDQVGNQSGGAGPGTGQFGQGDAGIVAYALFLERLEVDFYDRAVASGRLRGRGLELAKRFGADERAHLESLTGALEQLGGKEPPEPKFQFDFENEARILESAAQLESLGAGAYLAQVPRIQEKKILAAALSIHSVEARHASALAELLGRPITPDGPFATPAPSADVQRQTDPYLTR